MGINDSYSAIREHFFYESPPLIVLTVTSVILALEVDIHIVSTTGKWAIGPKFIMSRMNIQRDNLRRNIIKAQDVSTKTCPWIIMCEK